MCSPGVTVLVGPNGQGKTNVVEAIRYLSTLGSHRVGSSAPLIGDGHTTATVFAHLHHGERQITAGVTLKHHGANDATISGSKTKMSELPRWVSSVMFSPEDAAIIRGEPSHRRSFMDELVLSGSPSMAGTFQDFERVLKQRNSLLKSLRAAPKSADLSTLDTWSERFTAVAAEIIEHRLEYLAEIIPEVSAEYHNLAGGAEAAAHYQTKGYSLDSSHSSRDQIMTVLSDALRDVRQEELDRGMTLVGPHRDDVELTIQEKPARTHASQGETWSLALALRLAMAAWMRDKRSSGDPIVILDDVFAELDAHRREKLVSAIMGYEQLLITSAVEEDLPSGLGGARFDIKDGVVTPR